MSVHLYLAPAASGKTSYLIEQARQTAKNFTTIVRVCVPTSLQAQAWRHRLAETGGVLGVRVQLFHELYMECLDSLGQPYIELSEPVQYRLLQAVINDVPLAHYHSLRNSPGLINLLQNLIGELKAARIAPEQFASALHQIGPEARLSELAHIYAAYQERLRQQNWTDRSGLGWLAVEALANHPSTAAFSNSCLFVDGFDDFTQAQIDFLKILAQQAQQVVITLTGVIAGPSRQMAHRRFNKTRKRLEVALQVTAALLPDQTPPRNPVFAHLEANFREPRPEKVPGADVVSLIETPDRVAEVRNALRWLKTRLCQDALRPSEVALLARSITPYRPFILQIGDEFGLPVRLLDGELLRSNPLIAALLDLLRLILPISPTKLELALPYRLTVETWRSPYFDWSAQPSLEATEPIGIDPEDGNALDRVARHSRVVGGYNQWLEAFTALSRQDKSAQAADFANTSEVQLLQAKFERFVERITPPASGRYRDFVQWLEDLIGPDSELEARFPQPDPATPIALNMVNRARAVEITAGRDLAALKTLKEVLRGLVWAEQAITSNQTITFPQFLADLIGAIEANSYALPLDVGAETILVADVVQARGLPFRAVAVLGLAEGEFPANLSEDALLRNADREQLQQFGLPIDLPTESSETEFFYETITRPREQLLLTRPRLADNGALWKASPYWEEVNRLVEAKLETLSDNAPTPNWAASWPELMESLSTHLGYEAVRNWVKEKAFSRQLALDLAAQTCRIRQSRATGSPFDGSLQDLATQFQQHFAPPRPWSASQVEDYRACPFWFFVRRVLKLGPKEEPGEGLDSRQLGQIYHDIFERLYQAVTDPTDVDELLAKLPEVAWPILDKAPEDKGFRASAWWSQTRQEIVQNVRVSIVKLTEQLEDFIPIYHEVDFSNQKFQDGDDYFLLSGRIDRIEAADSCIRLIDYKTGGSSGFDNSAIREGKKLQLALYALAARDALGLGQPVDGFYWHIRHAEASSFSLKKFKDGLDSGPEIALKFAMEKAWEAVRGARAGYFVPEPPREGCPNYCPAANICWHYNPKFGD
ncbi:MAG: ATP-dependent helicase/deoxyribonuclease subunit B [Chloroflexota bacterium]|nr:MAG: ATP-dependent helicase/deoxyribonuclease subunit B [Chloroflexota bacterium]